MDDQLRTQDAVAQRMRALRRAQGSLDLETFQPRAVFEGDRVVVRATNIVTQDSFFGVPAAGRVQRFTATFTFQIAGGKVVRTWRNADDLGRLHARRIASFDLVDPHQMRNGLEQRLTQLRQ